MRTTAKLFMHGRSQAVRLPKEFRMPGTEVQVRREGNSVVLEPVPLPDLNVDEWFRKLASYNNIPFPERIEGEPVKPDNTIVFD